MGVKTGDGDDDLDGGAGDDTFVFSAGRDVIKDFTPGEDVLDLSGVDGIEALEDVWDAARERGGKLVLDLDDGRLILKGVELADLDADDFPAQRPHSCSSPPSRRTKGGSYPGPVDAQTRSGGLGGARHGRGTTTAGVSLRGPAVPEAFKREAVERVRTSGMTIVAVAEELGLHETPRTAVDPEVQRAGDGGGAAALGGPCAAGLVPGRPRRGERAAEARERPALDGARTEGPRSDILRKAALI